MRSLDSDANCRDGQRCEPELNQKNLQKEDDSLNFKGNKDPNYAQSQFYNQSTHTRGFCHLRSNPCPNGLQEITSKKQNEMDIEQEGFSEQSDSQLCNPNTPQQLDITTADPLFPDYYGVDQYDSSDCFSSREDRWYKPY